MDNTDTVIRIAETFNVSIDYLLIDSAPRRPLHTPATGIDNRLEAIAQLSDEDTKALNNVIDAFTTRTRLRAITNQAHIFNWPSSDVAAIRSGPAEPHLLAPDSKANA